MRYDRASFAGVWTRDSEGGDGDEMSSQVPSINNVLLNVLPSVERAGLGSLELVVLERDRELESPFVDPMHAYFVEKGLLSILATGNGADKEIEVGMIGPEGMTGQAIVLGARQAANRIIVQSPGIAFRVAAGPIRAAMERSPAVRALFLRYLHVLMAQMSQTALANGQGTLLQRLSRWILMWQDRLGTAEFEVTHDYVSLLLGVRRPGVTMALHRLEGENFIRSSRGKITVLNRAGLIRLATGFYGAAEASYASVIGIRLEQMPRRTDSVAASS